MPAKTNDKGKGNESGEKYFRRTNHILKRKINWQLINYGSTVHRFHPCYQSLVLHIDRPPNWDGDTRRTILNLTS